MATKWDRVPNIREEDVVKGVGEDIKKALKSTNGLRGAAVDSVEEAASRAASRLGGRGKLALGALGAGYTAGRLIDNATGIGKTLVDASGLGDMAADAATSGDRVTLTKDAQERIEKGALDKKPVKRSVSKTTISAEPAPMMKEEKDYGPGIRDDIGAPKEPGGDLMKRGGKVKHHAKGGITRSSPSKRADGIAQKGHTKGRMI